MPEKVKADASASVSDPSARFKSGASGRPWELRLLRILAARRSIAIGNRQFGNRQSAFWGACYTHKTDSIKKLIGCCAPVAQRLEQQTHNLLVRGSNPCGGTNEIGNWRLPIGDCRLLSADVESFPIAELSYKPL